MPRTRIPSRLSLLAGNSSPGTLVCKKNHKYMVAIAQERESVGLVAVCVWFHLHETQIQLGRRCEGRL